MSFGSKKQREPAEVKAMRERQLLDMVKLDEEENLRIKRLLRGQGGTRRAFKMRKGTGKAKSESRVGQSTSSGGGGSANNSAAAAAMRAAARAAV